MDEAPGDRLREARRKVGITAEELGAKAANFMGRKSMFSASTIRNQENGTNGIPFDHARAYCKILGISPEWLMFGRHPIEPSALAPSLSKEATLLAVRGLMEGARDASDQDTAEQLKDLAAWLSKRAFG